MRKGVRLQDPKHVMAAIVPGDKCLERCPYGSPPLVAGACDAAWPAEAVKAFHLQQHTAMQRASGCTLACIH